MATTNRGFAVPEGGDDVDIPGDVVNLTNTIIPGKTTAQLAAMSWADKPAGWLAYDTTLGKIVKSTGGSMVELTEGGPYLPSAGGTVSGELHVDAALIAASFYTEGDLRCGPRWIITQGDGHWNLIRMSPNGTQVEDIPFRVDESTGHVTSASHIGNVASGSTNAAGYLTVPVVAAPTGKSWSVTCNAVRVSDGAPLAVVGIPTTGTQVTFTCYQGTAPYQGAVNVIYHLIAY